MGTIRSSAAAMLAPTLKVPLAFLLNRFASGSCRFLVVLPLARHFAHHAGATVGNVGVLVAAYGGVCLTWILVNRIVCEYMNMMVRTMLHRIRFSARDKTNACRMDS
jgi:hypothetical protein